jgi:tetrahydromethanopterin S-methyltransferase subunit G
MERIMARRPASELEHDNLAVHVELCQQRYEMLEKRLENIEKKVGDIFNSMNESKSSLAKVIIGSTGTIIAGLISTIIVLLMKIH